MSTEILPFDFYGAQVRVVTIDNEPWFVLTDLAKVLDIAAVGRLASRLDDGVRQTHTIQDSLGRDQNAVIVSEAGMYEVVIRSDKPEAAAFRRWITSEVLPQIRRTGAYGVQAVPTGQELLALAVVEAQALLAAKDTRIAELTPRAEAWTVLADASGTYTVSDTGKLLASAGCATGPRRIFQQLADMKWIFKRGGIWTGYQQHINAGHLAEYAGSHFHPRTGERVLDAPTVRVTIEGLEALRRILGGAEMLTSWEEIAS